MRSNKKTPVCGIQFFAEGGGAGDGGPAQGPGVTQGAAAPGKGVKGSPLANVQYGIQTGDQPAAPDAKVQTTMQTSTAQRKAAFEALIKGEYKDLYDERMRDTIQKRLKGPTETAAKFTALAPALDILAKKYGKDSGDIEGLVKAIEADDYLFEEEALEQGYTNEQFRMIRAMQQENARLKQQEQSRVQKEKADKLYAAWMEQSEAVKQVYPGFDLQAEMANPQFTDLLRANVDIRTAYEVLHKDEIIPGAMQFAAKTVEEKLAKSIASGAARPVENGNASQSGAIVKSDPSKFTRADRREIARRVARGERIVL